MDGAWAGLKKRGLDELSPPEVERVLAELAAERDEYTSMIQDVSGWPDRSVLGRRVPTETEIELLRRTPGRWRAVVRLSDERAIEVAAQHFERLFVLDPLYDTGDLLYAAWHDQAIRDEHAQHLARQASHLVRLAPLLQTQQAVLAPEHLPGSWDPRPGWRRLRPDADFQTRHAWQARQALILLYWADRLDAVVVDSSASILMQFECECLSVSSQGEPWTLSRLHTDLPQPALLLRRILDGRPIDAQPSLPRTALRRQPLCLIAASPTSA